MEPSSVGDRAPPLPDARQCSEQNKAWILPNSESFNKRTRKLWIIYSNEDHSQWIITAFCPIPRQQVIDGHSVISHNDCRYVNKVFQLLISAWGLAYR